MKKLPIDVQSFEIMRSDAYYYVDKTPIIILVLTDFVVLPMSAMFVI
jgi:hypothetical protein